MSITAKEYLALSSAVYSNVEKLKGLDFIVQQTNDPEQKQVQLKIEEDINGEKLISGIEDSKRLGKFGYMEVLKDWKVVDVLDDNSNPSGFVFRV